MSRETLTPAVLSELENETYRPLILVGLDFPSVPVYAHSGAGDISFNGNTYKGVGQLGNLSVLEETIDLQTFGFSLELTGIDPALLAISLNDHIQGRAAEIYLAFLDEEHQIIPDPVGPWLGRMDAPQGEIGKTATIKIDIESRLADWERARIRRYTDADQQAEYPGDKFFEFVSEMQEKEITWGPKS